ncbi:glycosyltransferase family 4 protein [Vibrio fluvialis]|uniref:glycosyltransferase family 4 protein n=2 Tax=Vibrio fluvialis TaxID=676 RepID=UPI001302885E|nr:glycosyltransferase family 4 protein [Vibrio fluvialis]ELS8949599.1 glycosyltransferase family 4 protein [Vibrio fluvialis]MCG6385537.1 glycosyltransferase family 4 protein [Vibrio fluvialis]
MGKIYIYTNAISRKNGGSSSILDLANCMSDLGFDVEIRTVLGKMDRYIYQTSNVNKNLNIKCINNEVVSSSHKGKVKKVINKFLSFPYKIGVPQKAVVIDSYGIPLDYKNKLQDNGCKVVLNHAGSVKAYANYFMTTESESDKLEEYKRYIQTYDFVLFQSQSQANELDSIIGRKISLLIRPSVSDKDIVNCLNYPKNVLDKKKLNITVVGSVQKRKGQDVLIEIAQLLDSYNTEYVINVIGNVLEYDFYENLINDIRNKKLEGKIVFYGFKKDYLNYMNDSDIILQVSKEEGVSRILREAMALGKPIVSFKLDGTADLLEDGIDSLLVNPGDIKGISLKLQLLLNDKFMRDTLGIKAKQNFDKKYSYKIYSEQVRDFLISLRKS